MNSANQRLPSLMASPLIMAFVGSPLTEVALAARMQVAMLAAAVCKI
jgi:hypothetical protein